jgi:excisionase family DNA binding protein
MQKKKYHPDPVYGYIDVEGAAHLLGISKSKLYKMSADGKLPCYKPAGKLYFKISELKQWIESSSEVYKTY